MVISRRRFLETSLYASAGLDASRKVKIDYAPVLSPAKQKRVTHRQASLAYPANDLSCYLHTEQMENAYVMLKGENIAALVDFRKNRVLRFFAFGQLGTLQNLTYHTINDASYWFEGIHPYRVQDGAVLYPFRADKYSDDRASAIGFDEAQIQARFGQVNLYPAHGKGSTAYCVWSVRAKQTSLYFEVNSVGRKSDEDATGIEGTVYPLYDRVLVNGKEESLQYEFEPTLLGGPWVGDGTVEFRDSLGRMPRLRVTSKEGRVIYEAVELTKRLVGARSLIFRAEAAGGKAEVAVELLPNPVTISVNPLLQAGSDLEVRVLTTAPGVPTLELDEVEVPLKKVSRYVWEARIRPAKGRRNLVARYYEAQSNRSICAVGDFRQATIQIGDALLRLQQRTEDEWPEQEGMIPQVMNRNFTPRLWFAITAASEYMARTAMSLAAATLVTGDAKYVDGALRACRTYVLKSQKLGEGRIVAPIFGPNGKVPRAADTSWLRPSDFGIMVRGLLACYTGLNYVHRRKEASEALDLAYQVTMGLRALQGPHGEWSPRYNYFEPKYEGGNGFVNNPHYALWHLSEILAKVDPAKAKNVRALIQDQLESMPNFTSRQPITTGSVHGDEDVPNDPQSWASATALTLVGYLLAGQDWIANRAKTCSHAGIWVSDFYIDEPEHFALPAAPADLPVWVGGYLGGRAYGGMYDLVQEEARIIVAQFLDDQFSADASAYLFASRLAWAVESDGFVCGSEQTFPELYYRNREYAETLNYGGVGVYLLWYWQHHIVSCPSDS
jgi:hypothetical protein